MLTAKWIAYTDGGCAPSNPGPAGWGAVIVPPNAERKLLSGFIGPGTNQIAELSAAIEALEHTPLGASVELVSDSQYVLKGLSEWRAGWERRGWRNAKGEPVANRAYWELLFKLADARKLSVTWVKGHDGHPENEMADQLATDAIREGRAGQRAAVCALR